MPVGKTKGAGWQIGVSRTVPHPASAVWQTLVSPEGIAAWLGDGVRFSGEVGEPYSTVEGTVGEVRSYRPLNRIRLTWQPKHWGHDSTVQIALDDKGDRTRIGFHQERLADTDERAGQRAHWISVADSIERLLESRFG